MSKLAIALIIIQVVCLIGVALFIWTDYKKKHPPLCDNCKCLAMKRGGLCLIVHRYRCGRCGIFDHPPKICSEYRPKEGADHE